MNWILEKAFEGWILVLVFGWLVVEVASRL